MSQRNDLLFMDLEMDTVNNIIQIGVTSVHTTKLVIKESKDWIIFPENELNRSTAKFMKQETIPHVVPLTVERIRKEGKRLSDVLRTIMQSFGTKRFCYTWGSGDVKLVQAYCHRKRMDNPFHKHLDFGPIFHSMLGIQTYMSLGKAVQFMGLEFDGVPHDAGCDARNTARLFIEVSKRVRLGM